MTYEEKMARLDEILKKISQVGSSLSESVELFEEGMGLVDSMQAELDSAKKKVMILSGMSEEAKFEPFEGAE